MTSPATCLSSILRVPLTYPQSIRLEKVVTSPTYDPTSRPVDPGVEQMTRPDLTRASVGQADRQLRRLRDGISQNRGRGEQYGQPVSLASEGGSTVETAKSEAANVKDTAADAASGVKDVAKGEVSNVAA